MRHLIVFSHLRWNFVYQRPQHLLSRLAERFHVVFIEEPMPTDRPAYLERTAPCDGVEGVEGANFVRGERHVQRAMPGDQVRAEVARAQLPAPHDEERHALPRDGRLTGRFLADLVIVEAAVERRQDFRMAFAELVVNGDGADDDRRADQERARGCGRCRACDCCHSKGAQGRPKAGQKGR